MTATGVGTAAITVTSLPKSLAVSPGDVIKMEVFVKYLDGNSSNWTTALNNLIMSFSNPSAGTFIDGGLPGSIGSEPFPFDGLQNYEEDEGEGPKGYLNLLIFDQDHIFKTGGFERMTDIAKENGSNVPHEQLFHELLITEPGYVYIYLSNENESLVEVFFDDFKVEHVKSPVVQSDDYYPFGLRSRSYQRENSFFNRFFFNGGSEWIDDMSLGWYQTANRMYAPEIGRFWGVDALGDLFPSISPMLFGYNNPLIFNDPLGLNGTPCDVCPDDATLLDEVVVTASRLPSYSALYAEYLYSTNPIKRAIGTTYQKKGMQAVQDLWYKNRTIHFGQAVVEDQWTKDFTRVWGGLLNVVVTGPLLAIAGSPMLVEMIGEGSISISAPSIKTAIFGTGNVLSKSYLGRAAFNGTIETTNQLITNGFNPSELDVADIVAQGFLGLNTPQSAGATSVIDWKPFSTTVNNKFSFNFNTGAAIDFATGYTAGRLSSVPGIQGSNVQPMIQWGADLSMKVVSEGVKKSID